MVPMASLFDVAFLGHLTEIRHLAGVALATVLFNYIYWSFGFLRMGTTGTTAQAAGRFDFEGVILTLLRNSLIALSIGIIIVILQQPLQEFGFALMSASPEVKSSGRIYYQMMVWGAPATLLNFVLVGWFLGREQGGRVLLMSAVSNCSNVLLNYLLIVRFGWESAGAGLATALSQYLMLLVGISLICSEISLGQLQGITPPKDTQRAVGAALKAIDQSSAPKTISRRLALKAIANKVLDRNALKATFLLNRDILVRTFAIVSTSALFINLSSALGTLTLATNTLLMQVVALTSHFIDGLAFATESLAGSFRGQGANEQLAPLAMLSGGISLSLGITFALLFAAFTNQLFGLLTNHSDVVDQIDNYVLWLLPILGFGSIAFMLDGYFLGLTEGSILRKSMVSSVIWGFAPMAVVAWQFQSSHLLWLALSLFMVARAVTLGVKVPRTFNFEREGVRGSKGEGGK
ncbi:MAG: MATE family efflux transporter [Symploca sp. SIO1C4]|uniref:MATE family efflux transporter n=1 Tax=Symploca sp. SIO1C4 TaxID=2607765 RepID=A0A6B3NDK8_9CYAN|nr:MATE family efflux transporter [Symploca sp. SIO1C4]